MSLIPPRTRPFPRDTGLFREPRLFVLASEDRYAAKQYFDFFRRKNIHVEVLETPHGEGADPAKVVARLVSYVEKYQITEGDQFWALLDTDHWIKEGHRKNLIQAITAARLRGFSMAISNPCFDFWLLLHHENPNQTWTFSGCKDVGVRILETLGEFNKTNLKAEHYTLDKVRSAIARAKSLESTPPEGAAADFWPQRLGSRVYRLMDELAAVGFLSDPR
jgi:hypothetical protein